MNKKLTEQQEIIVLHFIENCRGKSTYGDCRKYMYDVYKIFKNDGRDVSTCSCLDRDTARKVDGFINIVEWSDEIRSTARFKSILPHLYKEIEEESIEDSTQPVTVDLDKLAKAVTKRKRKTKDE